MQEVEFRVLCANDGDSCNLVKGFMKDFKITQASKIDDFDHKGVKQFKSIVEATRRVGEIKSLAGDNLIDITMHVKRRI